MSYQTILTNLGLAKIATAIGGGGTLNISKMTFGDGAGNPMTPSSDQTVLVRQVYETPINSIRKDANNPLNYLIVEAIIPSTAGGWTVREVGLVDADGDLIAVANFPDTYKPVLSEGIARDLVVQIRIEVSNTEIVNLQIDPSIVLASRQWVVDNYSLASLLPGGNTGNVLTKKSNADGDTEWKDPAEGIQVDIDAKEEFQVVSVGQAVVNFAHVTTNGLAVYLDGVRLRGPDAGANKQYTIGSGTSITLEAPPAAAAKLHAVQNDPAATTSNLLIQNRLSEIQAAGASAQLSARQNLGIPEMSMTVSSVLNVLLPVGHVFETTKEGNPADYYGFGTWALYGVGRVAVCVDANDAAFATAGKTGGAKTHNLTTQEMPSHVHPLASDVASGAALAEDSNVAKQSSGGGDTYILTGTATAATLGKSGATGGGQAHNNLQPYVALYRWVRTA